MYLDTARSQKILTVRFANSHFKTLLNYLEEAGYDILAAGGPDDIIFEATTRQPDLIFLGTNLRPVSGFELCRRLKASRSTKTIPVLFMSPFNEKNYKIRAFRAGASDYVTSPFEYDEILARIKTLLDLQNEKRRLRQSHDAITQFKAVMAHELRNPFNLLIFASRMLEHEHDSLPDEKRAELIRSMRQISEDTLEMLDELLDWSRSQSGAFPARREDVDLSVLVRKNMKLLYSRAVNKDIRLINQVKTGTWIHADPRMVGIILRNLLTNGVKYTGAGGEVRCAARVIDDMVDISVTDTGVGMTDAALQKLFRPDVTRSEPGTADERGAGIGLFLCRQLAERIGGDIRAESAPGKGSTFRFTAPLPYSERKSEDIEEASPASDIPLQLPGLGHLPLADRFLAGGLCRRQAT